MVEVLSGPERRRRRTPQEKIAIIQQTMEPGMNVSHVARLHGVGHLLGSDFSVLRSRMIGGWAFMTSRAISDIVDKRA